MSGVTARVARCLVALSLCAAGAAGCAGTAGAGTVTIVIPWDKDSAEYNAFESVIGPWKQQHRGVQVVLDISRVPAQQLDFDLAAGNPPDLVDMPSPVALYKYKEEGKGPMPLDINLSSYDQPWRSLAQLGTSTVYAVPIKADVKSLIWYHAGVPTLAVLSTWTALRKFSRHGTPWCLGLASGPASGWPGADWVADILLSGNGFKTYENWLDGKLAWTPAHSKTVEHAWNLWGALMGYGAAIHGGVRGALETPFNNPERIGMTTGRCELEHGALSATGLRSTHGYSYAPFPSISGTTSQILVSGDFMGLFTSNPNAKALLAYLAKTDTQTQWVNQQGYAFSADHDVKPDAYRNNVQRQIARMFFQPAHGGAKLCFGADDMMTTDMSTAFQQAVLDYVNQHAALDKSLKGLQTTQKGAGHSPAALAEIACASNNKP